MKYIATAGYFATGSSAVTDFLTEFSNIRVPDGGLEWRFLQDPDGIRTLEYNIIENNHRHNTSHAIKRYIKMCELTQKNGIEFQLAMILLKRLNAILITSLN